MNRERLLNVAKALRESPKPDKFGMHRYGTCSTPMCALGHYAARQDLQDFLTMRNWGVAYAATNDSADYWDPETRQHFEISAGEAEALFGPEGCNDACTPLEAAEYIEHFVEEHT